MTSSVHYLHNVDPRQDNQFSDKLAVSLVLHRHTATCGLLARAAECGGTNKILNGLCDATDSSL